MDMGELAVAIFETIQRNRRCRPSRTAADLGNAEHVVLELGMIEIDSANLEEPRGAMRVLAGNLGNLQVGGNFTGSLNVPLGSIQNIAVTGAINSVVPAGALWPIRAHGIGTITAEITTVRATIAAAIFTRGRRSSVKAGAFY